MFKEKLTKRILSPLFAVMILIILLLFFLLYRFFHFNQAKVSESSMQLLSAEEYQGLFVSMYPIREYDENLFFVYRNSLTIKISDPVKNLASLSAYLERGFSSGNALDYVYIGLDPRLLWDSCGKSERRFTNFLEQDLFSYMAAHPETRFEFFFPCFEMDYWTALSDKQLQEAFTLYQTLGSMLLAKENALVHFAGYEPGYISNPKHYSPSCYSETCDKLLLDYLSGVYAMHPERLRASLSKLEAAVSGQKTSPASYPDLSDWYFVFFGDSVTAFGDDTDSIAGVVLSLSGAEGSRLGQGGAYATRAEEEQFSFPTMADCLVNKDTQTLAKADSYTTGLNKYLADVKSGTLDHKQLCFVISFGLNDYFTGYPLENADNPLDTATFSGALQTGIRTLKAAFPEAKILLLSPNYCHSFSKGTDINSPVGDQLWAYAQIVSRVAKETQTDFIDVFSHSGIDENTQYDYLGDQIHPNISGRYLIGEMILRHFTDRQ